MPRLPQTFYNPVSLIGGGIALVTLGAIVIFFVMDLFTEITSPYIGIFTYMVLPAIMLAGLLLIPGGVWIERQLAQRRFGRKRRYLIVNLNKHTHRTGVMFFLAGTMLLLIISAAGMYQAYNYTESVEFCGEVCHVPMTPEYVAYQQSPHARVLCAECHIGEGADWFVKAKISGMYQVYSVLFDKYSRPIETPVHDLRPARETCEHCHWPQKFSSNLEMAKTYYPLDTTATRPWSVVLQLKIGGGESELGPTEGIHWHMNTENRVDYIAVDEKRQDIPWVRITHRNGEERIYRSRENSVVDSSLAKDEFRTMDCIDCHNRPSHIYYPPFRTLNDAMKQDRIAADLPDIRAIASHALTSEYVDTKHALEEISEFIRSRYKTFAPETARKRKQDIDRSIVEIQRIYKRNFFPSMKVDWRRYPDNIGHMYYDGCFRCHDNRHVSEDGKVLTNDCSLCHLIVAQGPTGEMESDLYGLEFIHPTDIDGAWKDEYCTSCHTGE